MWAGAERPVKKGKRDSIVKSVVRGLNFDIGVRFQRRAGGRVLLTIQNKMISFASWSCFTNLIGERGGGDLDDDDDGDDDGDDEGGGGDEGADRGGRGKKRLIDGHVDEGGDDDGVSR